MATIFGNSVFRLAPASTSADNDASADSNESNHPDWSAEQPARSIDRIPSINPRSVFLSPLARTANHFRRVPSDQNGASRTIHESVINHHNLLDPLQAQHPLDSNTFAVPSSNNHNELAGQIATFVNHNPFVPFAAPIAANSCTPHHGYGAYLPSVQGPVQTISDEEMTDEIISHRATHLTPYRDSDSINAEYQTETTPTANGPCSHAWPLLKLVSAVTGHFPWDE